MLEKSNASIDSVTNELLNKSREAVLSAVQIFNNPNILFKHESFIVLMIIGWTYLLHAYYRSKGVEYRYYDKSGSKKVYKKTKHGADMHWELEKCLNDNASPIDNNASNNLKFLIGLRHEIEHQMTSRIDDLLSARFQACCLNFNHYIQELFGKKYSIDKYLAFSLQFSTISREQKDLLKDHLELPDNIQSYICEFDDTLSDEEYANNKFAYRILFVPKTALHRGRADRVIEFVKSDDPMAKVVNKEYAHFKEVDKNKYLANQIVTKMQKEGYIKFTMHKHTKLWQSLKAKDPQKGYGGIVAGKYWYWYDRWVEKVSSHCKQHAVKFR